MSKILKSLENGFGTAYSFILIIFISAIAFVVVMIFKSSDIKTTDELQLAEETQAVANLIIEELLNDETPEADSPTDRIWDRIEDFENEYSANIRLEDISSRINPNFIRNEIIDNTEISRLLFKEGHSMSELEQFRNDKGFGMDLEIHYEGFFSDDAIEELLSPYSYINLNIADELAIANMHKVITDDSFESESFRTKIREQRINKNIIHNNEIKSFLGNYYYEIYPVINAAPAMNIHFISEKLLLKILKYDFGSSPLPQPQLSEKSIITSRNIVEIKTDDLKNYFGIDKIDHPIYDYLGVKTWFWKITIDKLDVRRELIIAEIPAPEYAYKPGLDFFYNNSKRSIRVIKNVLRK